MSAPSRETVECMYCPYRSRKDNLRLYDHFNRNHPGQPEAYKPEKGQSSLLDFFGRPANTREGASSSSSGNQVNPPRISGLSNAAPIGHNADVERLAGKRARETAEVSDDATMTRSSAPSGTRTAENETLRPAPPPPSHVFDSMQGGVAALVRAQGAKLDEIKALLDKHLANDTRHQRELDLRRRIASIGPFKLDDDLSRVRCSVCDSNKWCIPRNERPGFFDKLGVFSVGDCLPSAERQRDLIASLKDHLKVPSHNRCVSIGETGKTRTRRSEALAVARTAYFTVVEGHSRRSFERLLALQAENQVGFGDKNHSRVHFLPFFIDAMNYELRARTVHTFETRQRCFNMRPSPVTASCDKLTTYRRTVQTTCAMTMIGGRVVAYLLEAPICANKSGMGLTATLLESLVSFGFTEEFLRDNLVGLATDGEYHGLKVGTHLSDALECADGQIYHSWCIAHRIELAVDDSNKNITDMRSVLHPAMPSKHGSAYEALRGVAEELGVPFAAPLSFSATRWASSESRVFRNFIINYRAICELGTVPQVKQPAWLVKFAIYHDSLNKVASASCTAQTVNSRPWQVLTSIHCLRDDLIIASAELQQLIEVVANIEDQRSEHISFLDKRFFHIDSYPTLGEIDFVGQTWQTVVLDPVAPWLFKLALEFCGSWTAQLISALGKRIINDAPAWLEASCQCLSGEAIFGSPDDVCLKPCDCMLDTNGLSESLRGISSPEGYFGIIVEFVCGFKPALETSTDIDGLLLQYLELRDRLREKFLPMPPGNGMPKIDMEAVWAEVHTNAKIYSGCEDCIYIIGCVAMKSHCESVVESQCSLLNNHGPKRHLGHSGLSKEAFISWNSFGISSSNVDHFLVGSLDRMPKEFTGFRRKMNDPKSKNKKFVHSKVIDRVLAHRPHGELAGPRDFIRPQIPGRQALVGPDAAARQSPLAKDTDTLGCDLFFASDDGTSSDSE